MACFASIIIRYRFVDAECTGKPCDDCQDPVWFKGRDMQKKLTTDTDWEPLLHLCTACADCRENELEEP